MQTKYMVRAREELEDEYLGRAIDIVIVTDNEQEARETYKKYMLIGLCDVNIDVNLSEKYPDKQIRKEKLQLAHQLAMEKCNKPLIDDDGYPLFTWFDPEYFDKHDCVIEIAELLGINTLQFDVLTNPVHVIYFPHSDKYFCRQDEFPPTKNSSAQFSIDDAELLFSTNINGMINNDKIAQELFSSIPIICKSSIEELTHSPDNLRQWIDDNSFFELYEDREDKNKGVVLSTATIFRDYFSKYQEMLKLNKLLNEPLFIEKQITVDEFVTLYQQSLDNMQARYNVY